MAAKAKKAKTPKFASVDKLFRITQNVYSKKFRVEKNYPAEQPDGTFEDCWWDVGGPYETLSSAQSSMKLSIESLKADLAKWVPV